MYARRAEIRHAPPLGFDADNDSAFMNEAAKSHCAAAWIAFTRRCLWRRNGQAWVERKNGAAVRRFAGSRRLEGQEAAAAPAASYRSARLGVNGLRPAFKFAEMERDGAVMRTRHHVPAACDIDPE